MFNANVTSILKEHCKPDNAHTLVFSEFQKCRVKVLAAHNKMQQDAHHWFVLYFYQPL